MLIVSLPISPPKAVVGLTSIPQQHRVASVATTSVQNPAVDVRRHSNNCQNQLPHRGLEKEWYWLQFK